MKIIVVIINVLVKIGSNKTFICGKNNFTRHDMVIFCLSNKLKGLFYLGGMINLNILNVQTFYHYCK